MQEFQSRVGGSRAAISAWSSCSGQRDRRRATRERGQAECCNDGSKVASWALACAKNREAVARGGADATLSVLVLPQLRPSISPLTTRILSAAGARGNPGIVRMSPMRTTTNPAPARRRTSRILGMWPLGAPMREGSSENEYWVLATQIGRGPHPPAPGLAD